MPFGRSLTLTQPMASSMSRIYSPVIVLAERGISNNNIPKIGNKRQKMKMTLQELNQPEDLRTIDEIAAEIDTTLTPEQRTYVDMLKKRMSGGTASQRVRCKKYLMCLKSFAITILIPTTTLPSK